MERAPVPRETHAPEREDADETRIEPIMEAPEVSSRTSPDAASWNPAQGDRSFGYGAGQAGAAPTGASGDRIDAGDDAP